MVMILLAVPRRSKAQRPKSRAKPKRAKPKRRRTSRPKAKAKPKKVVPPTPISLTSPVILT
jgi:hypothetical protein